MLLKDFVASFDENQDGHLEGQEFTHLMNGVEGLSLKADEMLAVEKAIDTDADG